MFFGGALPKSVLLDANAPNTVKSPTKIEKNPLIKGAFN
jgi:hypothetical protein